MNQPARPMPRPTAQVEAYVQILGVDLTIAFLLKFGGAQLYLPNDPKGKAKSKRCWAATS